MSAGRAASGRFFAEVYDVVRAVPEGMVTTYGDVSRVLTGQATAARTVGWALHALPPELVHEVPWWRVVNAAGRISTSCREHSAEEQRARLEDEGVRFVNERIDLERFRWLG